MLERFLHRSSSVLHIWTWLSFLLFLSCDAQQAGPLQNVTVVNTSPDITYTPFLCNSTLNDTSCNGGWRILEDADGSTVVSTDGPTIGGLDVLPQMFLRFRAANLSMTTSTLSNASMNVTVFSGNTVLNALVNSSVGSLSVVNLPDTQTTTISITYIRSSIQSRLDIGNITITVSNGSASSSFLPTQTLPPSISLPTIIPPNTSDSSTSSSSSGTNSANSNSVNGYKNKLIANAVGLTVGLGLGLTAFVCAGYGVWRRYRRMKKEREVEVEGFYSERDVRGGVRNLNMGSLEPTGGGGGGASVRGIGVRLSSYKFSRVTPTKDNMDTRWFNF